VLRRHHEGGQERDVTAAEEDLLHHLSSRCLALRRSVVTMFRR